MDVWGLGAPTNKQSRLSLPPGTSRFSLTCSWPPPFHPSPLLPSTRAGDWGRLVVGAEGRRICCRHPQLPAGASGQAWWQLSALQAGCAMVRLTDNVVGRNLCPSFIWAPKKMCAGTEVAFLWGSPSSTSRPVGRGDGLPAPSQGTVGSSGWRKGESGGL